MIAIRQTIRCSSSRANERIGGLAIEALQSYNDYRISFIADDEGVTFYVRGKNKQKIDYLTFARLCADLRLTIDNNSVRKSKGDLNIFL